MLLLSETAVQYNHKKGQCKLYDPVNMQKKKNEVCALKNVYVLQHLTAPILKIFHTVVIPLSERDTVQCKI